MSTDIILNSAPLGFTWPTVDPFLFCVYHDDQYPRGNAGMGPDASLIGREIGQDFAGKDGWRMYHGATVPGFPAHPHRGFETVTIVRRGVVDHADSLGATARFGAGDVQWLTAGQGIVHSEMFPLREIEKSNPLELFQIWLNLPARNKMVPAHFTMMWSAQIPRKRLTDANGRTVEVVCIAGHWDELCPLAPPPNSWAAQGGADLAIWTIKLEPGARLQLPAAATINTRRNLYLFKGAAIEVAGLTFNSRVSIEVRADTPVELVNGEAETELLMLQGRPIGEPVAQHGPFVMNTVAEIRQAFSDYQRTRFGGWPWPSEAPVHAREQGRFAKHADGRLESP